MGKFISEKEQVNEKRGREIKEISVKIESVLQDGRYFVQPCDKCCSFLKRIKDSLVEYRRYLTDREK